MKPDLQRRVQRYGWDKAAPYYDSGWQRQLWPAQERLLKEAAPQSGEKILDISCGTGLVTFPLAEAVASEGSVTAVDLSEGMIEKARKRAGEKGIGNITFRHMDAEELDFPDNTFDKVICSLGLMYFPDPARALSEMCRVLVPGGRAVALVWGERAQCGWADIFPIVDRRVKSDVCPLFFQLGTGGTLSRNMQDAGFEEIRSERFSIKLHFQSDEEAIVGAFLGGAVALAYQKFDDQAKEEVHEEYLDSIKQYGNGSGYDIPGEFVLATATKK